MSTRTALTTLLLLISSSQAWAEPAYTPTAAGSAVKLLHQRQINPGVQSLPRLKPTPGMAYDRINHALTRLDAEARSSIKECDAMAKEMEAPAGGSYTRKVSVPMTGPGFLTVLMEDDTYCGTAYPTLDRNGITYDLLTGKPVDWVDLLGPQLGGTTDKDSKTGKPTGYLSSPALFRLWKEARGPSNDEPGNEICADTPSEDTGALSVWADASELGIAVQSMDVVHATAVCGRPAVIPLSALRGKGVSAQLLDSIAAGKAAHGRRTAAARQ